MIGCDGEGTWRGRKTSIYIVRNHVKNGRLTVVEMISRNIKGVNGVETIAGATPTPVEMEITVGIVSVTNESMAFIGLCTRIIGWETLVKIGHQHVFPFRLGVAV